MNCEPSYEPRLLGTLHKLPTRAGESTQPAADFHALKKDLEQQLQATVEAQSRSYAAALKAGTSSRVSPKNKTKTSRTQADSSQTSSSKSKGPSKPKVPVDGARKIWGTMRETSASAITTTLAKLTSLSSEQRRTSIV